VIAWRDNGNDLQTWDRLTSEGFEEAYNGEHDSEQDFAKSLADDLGLLDTQLRWPANCIDWEQATRELFCDYWSAPSLGGVHVFRSI
jgi:antirestriction protein